MTKETKNTNILREKFGFFKESVIKVALYFILLYSTLHVGFLQLSKKLKNYSNDFYGHFS